MYENIIYDTMYGDVEIKIFLERKGLEKIKKDEDVFTYTKNSLYSYHQFCVRFNQEQAVSIKIHLDKDEKELKKLNELLALIDNFEQEVLIDELDIKTKQINFTDALVVSSSMICKIREHHIIPYKGIIKILTRDNIETAYSIYVGYCRNCDLYYVFDCDFEKMMQKGKPLCGVYFYKELIKGEIQNSFCYKSQSVLATKGYNVQASNELTEESRQEILKECLDKGIIEIHDLLDFFNWLIRTRQPLPKYKNAISKWKKDCEFVEAYKEDIRDMVNIQSFFVKAKTDLKKDIENC